MAKKKSIKTVKIPMQAVNLFRNLIYNFPYKDMNEMVKRTKNNRPIKILWGNLIIKGIEKEGFNHLFEIFPNPGDILTGPIYTNEQMSKDLTNSFFKALKQIETMPIKGIMEKNEYFQFIELVLEILTRPLKYIEQIGGWDEALISNQNDLLYMFGMVLEKDRYVDLDFYCSQVNEILKIYYGTRILELFPDGSLEYVEYTEEIQQQYAVIKSLVGKKMDNVLTSIKKVRENLYNNEYNEAMYYCRKLTETFFKDYLISKKITSVTVNGKLKKINDMTVSDLMDTVKKEINSIITYPSFVKPNSIDNHLRNYILSISNFISTMTNEFSHGKGTSSPTTYKATKIDVETTFGFIISFMANFLYFLKK